MKPYMYCLAGKYIGVGLIIVASILMLSSSGLCQVSHTSAQFLLITPDARGKSLGEGGSVFSRGAISVYYNPALLVTSELFSAEYNRCTYLPEISDDLIVKNLFMSSNYQDLIYLGFGYSKFSYGTQEYTDEYGNSLGTSESYDRYFGFWSAMSFDDKNSAGFGLKFIKSRLAGGVTGPRDESTVGFDFGFISRGNFPELTWQYDKIFYPGLRRLIQPERANGLSFGLSVTNLGEGIGFGDIDNPDPLPRKLRIGTGFQAVDTEPLGLQLTLDGTRIMVGESDIAWSYGLEGEFYYLAVFRIGRYYDFDNHQRYTTIGFSIGPEWLRLDYSKIPGEYDYDWNRKAGEYSFSIRCNISREILRRF